MSKIGNHRVGLQETDAYESGYQAAGLGVPRLWWEAVRPDRQVEWLLGHDDWHTENGQFGVGA